MHEVTVAGDGFRLVLRVSGYESPALVSGADANWLIGDAELEVGADGFFAARRNVPLRTEELAAFRDALALLVVDLEGEATLAHLENDVGCTVRLQRGAGELDAFIRVHSPEISLRVKGVHTDQSYLQQTARQLDALVTAFPVRGDAFA